MNRSIADLQRQTNANWLRAAIQEEGSAPFVLVNALRPQATPADVLALIRPRLPHGVQAVALLSTTPQAVQDVGLPLRSDQRRDFAEGTPVLVIPFAVDALPERSRGREPIGADIARSRDALYVAVALSVERIRACVDRQGGKEPSSPTSRSFVFELIADAVAGDRFDGGDVKRRRIAFTQNAFREGQALLPVYFPGVKAGTALRQAYQQVYSSGPAVNFQHGKEAELRRLRTLSWLHLRASSYNQSQHAMSASMRDGQSLTAEQHQALANARTGGPGLDALMDAAIVGDLNPARLVANLASWSTEFALGQRLGLLSRCRDIVLEPMHMERLSRLLNIGVGPDDADCAEVRAARLVRELALQILPADEWRTRIALSRGRDLSLSLSRRPRESGTENL